MGEWTGLLPRKPIWHLACWRIMTDGNCSALLASFLGCCRKLQLPCPRAEMPLKRQLVSLTILMRHLSIRPAGYKR